MRLTEIAYPGRPPVSGYGPGFFRIGAEVIEGPALLLPAGFGAWQGWPEIAPILAAAESLDLLLLGTGAAPSRPEAPVVAALEAAGIAVEAMAAPPACRSYNVLLAEGRRVAAALMPV